MFPNSLSGEGAAAAAATSRTSSSQKGRTAPLRGLRRLCAALGDDLLVVLAAQQVLRDALALLKLGQDDGDVSVGGRLPEDERKKQKKNSFRMFPDGFWSLNNQHHTTE